MKRPSILVCPNCESILDYETAPREEGYVEGFADYKAFTCPCCTFFVENSVLAEKDWIAVAELAIEKGATLKKNDTN